jgi:hypothetical protein
VSGLLLFAAGLLPGSALGCPCVDTAVVRVVEEERRLLATVSETSRVMITAALYELLLEEIQPNYGDWETGWRVSFYTTASAAAQGEDSAAGEHVADYDRARRSLILWPRLTQRREEIELEIQ